MDDILGICTANLELRGDLFQSVLFMLPDIQVAVSARRGEIVTEVSTPPLLLELHRFAYLLSNQPADQSFEVLAGLGQNESVFLV